MAFVWCYKFGDYLDEKNKKKHGRKTVSVFK